MRAKILCRIFVVFFELMEETEVGNTVLEAETSKHR